MQTEPIAVATAIKEAVSSGLKLLVLFAIVTWSAEQFAGIMLVVDSILAVVLLLWQARSRSTSIAEPRIPAGTVVTSYDPATGQDVGAVVAPQG